MTVIPGIGYADPDMSHFTSRHYWEVGVTDAELETGWLGRYLVLPDHQLCVGRLLRGREPAVPDQRHALDQLGMTSGTGQRRDRAVQAEIRQRSGLAGRRTEPGTPQQAAGMRLREPAWIRSITP
jgi:hypothetical protein